MLETNNALTSELEWMLQNSQISDAALAGALARQYFPALEHMALLMNSIENTQIEPARSLAREAIRKAVASRHRYSGEHRLRVWLLHLLFQASRRPFNHKRDNQNVSAASEQQPEPLITKRLIPGYPAWQKVQQAGQTTRLAFGLRYVQGLSLPEIAYVLGERTKLLHARLNTMRAQLHSFFPSSRADAAPRNDADLLFEGSPDLHEDTEQQVLADLDGLLDGENHHDDRDQMRSHIADCSRCSAYAARQAELDKQLVRLAQSHMPLPEMDEPAIELLEAELANQADRKSRRGSFPVSFKEAALSILVIAVVALVVRFSGALDPAPTEAPAAGISLSQPLNTPQAYLPREKEAQAAAPTSSPQPSATATAASLPDSGDKTAANLELNIDDPAAVADDYLNGSHSGALNLAAMLHYWEWTGNRSGVMKSLQPNQQDLNVMPYEMVRFVQDKTDLLAVQRMAGDVDLLKQLLDAGIPVMVERGLDEQEGWTGVYEIVVGYDDQSRDVTLASFDSGQEAREKLDYDSFRFSWQAFNYGYMVVYPDSKAETVQRILGPHMDEGFNYNFAAQRASMEIYTTTGRAQYFAWFNRGTSLSYVDDYSGAAAAFDEAFLIYNQLAEAERPARMLWYQTRPYWAYFYTARYRDLVELATSTLEDMERPSLEESLYWRALAREALGDLSGAVADLRESVKINPNFVAGISQLERLDGGS